ncbi:MAG: DNA-3-methyladenine glycosylase [Oscillospiraceae bacterium]|jgi:N-glycosylase/DNA lyase|nr:DNA-3-methyladenine glycosylase [Oscillospiraceae bacterium]
MYKISDTTDFSPPLIFTCGQCFRFDEVSDGVWRGAAFGRVLTVSAAAIDCTAGDYENVWRVFFDMDTDYAAIRKAVSINAFMSEAAEFGRGIRILRQDFWETLCSFIISQQNNIPRIKGIIRRLCAAYGNPLEDGYSAFPTAEALAALDEGALRELGLGYRAPYVLSAARAFARGGVDRENLTALHGVGAKVANCVMLYGLHRMDVFPVDTWMRRGMGKYFPKNFDPREFGAYAGAAQQYIFHYVRYLHGKTGVTNA